MPKILIVDDNDENRYVLKNFFKLFGLNSGIELLEAVTGEEAVKIAAQTKPDLILMDVRMETDYAGLDATRVIRSNPLLENSVIWMLTSSAMEAYENEESDREKCLKAGCDDYISKPFDQTKLLMRISTLLKVEIPERIKKRLGI
jgi:CheY-like chemotaxis protein